MKAWRYMLWGVIALLMAATCASATESPMAHPVAVVLRVNGPISPASADYVVRGIEQADSMHAGAIVVELDTPGGLSSSMRDIIKAILASPVPVIGYVAPSGARAASAGTYIMYACHVAAMAPATNIGAATPVSLTGGGSVPLPGSSSGKSGRHRAKTPRCARSPTMPSPTSARWRSGAAAMPTGRKRRCVTR